MPQFSTFSTAVSGLSAAQRAMDVIGQNVVNASTEGYTRQQVQLSSIGATTSGAFHTGSNLTMLGGVQIDGIVRVRNTFLEQARVTAGAGKQALDAQANALSGVEQLLNEPGDGGLQALLDDFYASWQDLAQRPANAAAGAVVLQRGSAVAAQLRFVSSGISQRWQSARAELDTTIDQLNRAATDLAGVNQAILEGKVADRPVNELLDRRDLLVRQIGDLVGGRSVESQDGTVSVVVNGITAVSGSHAETFTLTGAGTIEDATSNPPQISLGPHPMPVTSGRAAGLLAVTSTDLPNLTIQLDNVALALRDVVNGQHTAGFTLAGAGGGDFFDATGAADISVVPTSADQLAVAGATGVVDGANALAIADLAQDALARVALGAPGPSEEWRVLTAGLGSQLQGLNRAGDVQESVLSSADAAVNADAGVNLDEEMAALLMYQRSYQASARVLTAVDEMLDTLVNRTGTIGR